MLVELHLDEEAVCRWNEVCNENHYELASPSIFPLKGFYDETFEFCYQETKNITYENEYKVFKGDSNMFQYGVADNIEQIKEYFKNEIEDPFTKYVISLRKIVQNKNENGGWRWHKWGHYIGVLKPQCEYLNDEDFGNDFQGFVVCFHLKKID